MTETTAERFASLLLSNNATSEAFEVELDDLNDLALIAVCLERRGCSVQRHPHRPIMTVGLPNPLADVAVVVVQQQEERP